MKIFISIASYQDPLLKATVNSAFNNADKPENLVFGICDQSNFPLDLEEFSFSSQIRFEHVDPKFLKDHVGQEKEYSNSLLTKITIFK